MASANAICDSPITKTHLETALLEGHPGDKNQLISANGTVISKGLGFLSDVMRVDLKWTIPDNEMPNRIILKAPKIDNINEILEKMGDVKIGAEFVHKVHEAECIAYNILKNEKSPPVPIPRVYACWPVEHDRPGLLAMEDMGAKAGIVDNIADGLNLAKWRNIVACLADLHAWSLTTEVPWREKVPPVESLFESFKEFEKANEHNVDQAMIKYPEYLGHIDKSFILQENTFENCMKLCQRLRDISDDVLQHGDAWCNNIMFVKNADGTLSDEIAAFLDWQISSKGAGVNDLTRLETWCINHDLRRQHYKEMLHFYHDRLTEKSKGQFTTSFADLEKMYELSFVNNGTLTVIMIDAMLAAIAKVDEDETGFRKKEMLGRSKAAYDDAVKYSANNK